MDSKDNKHFEPIARFIKAKWAESIVPELVEYIKIPCKSPAFDSNWEANGYLEQAIQQFKDWALNQGVPNMALDIIRLPGRTPLLFIEIQASTTANPETILLYGHMDKQPEMSGWDADKGPWLPVIIDNKLYGRGGADDGYALFAALTAINSLVKQKLEYPRCVILIEACEESGSDDLPFYVDHLKERIQTPSLVICLDSGCANYEQFWVTTSLRGNIRGVLTVELIKQGLHSGAASGIVPSSFRVIRQLLSRLENEQTGEILLKDLYTEIPKDRIEEAKITAQISKEKIYTEIPFHENVLPVSKDYTELLLNKTWRPQLAITGASGLPEVAQAGNVMRPKTSLVLSLRIPPNVDSNIATQKIKECLENNPPYNSKVTFISDNPGDGWNAPATAPWLQTAIDRASNLFFKNKAAYWGEGGTIPFMAMLGEKFPNAQFVITGVLGPKSNAHGPNEFLHLPMAEKLTGCIAYIINAFCTRKD